MKDGSCEYPKISEALKRGYLEILETLKEAIYLADRAKLRGSSDTRKDAPKQGIVHLDIGYGISRHPRIFVDEPSAKIRW